MRPRAGLWALGLQALARGALATVFSLLLLEKGVSLARLPVAMGCYSAVALLAELPSGFLADLAGRRCTFLAAQAVQGLGLAALMAARGPGPVFFAIVLMGLARALSSGSMEALVVELFLGSEGPGSLPRVTMLLEVSDTAGMALGALAGGVLHWWGGGSQPALAISLAFTLASLATAALLTREPASAGTRSPRPDPRAQLSLAAGCLRQGQALPGVMVSAALTGWLISGLETYWQPRFTGLLDPGRLWLLGVLGGCYYLASVEGSVLGERLLRRFSPWQLMRTGGPAAALVMAALSLAAGPALFFVLYLLVYLLIALPNLAQTVILNQNAPEAVRATLLSVKGLALQLGGLAGSAFAALTVERLGIPGLWTISAAVFATGILLTARRTQP